MLYNMYYGNLLISVKIITHLRMGNKGDSFVKNEKIKRGSRI
ncbi:hypothetical protein LEP1GSC166_1924 [Leptospira kirschneri]|nr:hypothetical protein LEP1GSC166_1924 [Leptospira kirschneri]